MTGSGWRGCGSETDRPTRRRADASRGIPRAHVEAPLSILCSPPQAPLPPRALPLSLANLLSPPDLTATLLSGALGTSNGSLETTASPSASRTSSVFRAEPGAGWRDAKHPAPLPYGELPHRCRSLKDLSPHQSRRSAPNPRPGKPPRGASRLSPLQVTT